MLGLFVEPAGFQFELGPGPGPHQTHPASGHLAVAHVETAHFRAGKEKERVRQVLAGRPGRTADRFDNAGVESEGQTEAAGQIKVRAQHMPPQFDDGGEHLPGQIVVEAVQHGSGQRRIIGLPMARRQLRIKPGGKHAQQRPGPGRVGDKDALHVIHGKGVAVSRQQKLPGAFATGREQLDFLLGKPVPRSQNGQGLVLGRHAPLDPSQEQPQPFPGRVGRVQSPAFPGDVEADDRQIAAGQDKPVGIAAQDGQALGQDGLGHLQEQPRPGRFAHGHDKAALGRVGQQMQFHPHAVAAVEFPSQGEVAGGPQGVELLDVIGRRAAKKSGEGLAEAGIEMPPGRHGGQGPAHGRAFCSHRRLWIEQEGVQAQSAVQGGVEPRGADVVVNPFGQMVEQAGAVGRGDTGQAGAGGVPEGGGLAAGQHLAGDDGAQVAGLLGGVVGAEIVGRHVGREPGSEFAHLAAQVAVDASGKDGGVGRAGLGHGGRLLGKGFRTISVMAKGLPDGKGTCARGRPAVPSSFSPRRSRHARSKRLREPRNRPLAHLCRRLGHEPARRGCGKIFCLRRVGAAPRRPG